MRLWNVDHHGMSDIFLLFSCKVEVTLPIYFDREMANVKAKVSKKVLSYLINTLHNKTFHSELLFWTFVTKVQNWRSKKLTNFDLRLKIESQLSFTVTLVCRSVSGWLVISQSAAYLLSSASNSWPSKPTTAARTTLGTPEPLLLQFRAHQHEGQLTSVVKKTLKISKSDL